MFEQLDNHAGAIARGMYLAALSIFIFGAAGAACAMQIDAPAFSAASVALAHRTVMRAAVSNTTSAAEPVPVMENVPVASESSDHAVSNTPTSVHEKTPAQKPLLIPSVKLSLTKNQKLPGYFDLSFNGANVDSCGLFREGETLLPVRPGVTGGTSNIKVSEPTVFYVRCGGANGAAVDAVVAPVVR